MKIKYRPEIDSLRALAVISVIIYHAKINIFNLKILEGGFLGVDIFFVISGYLITSIIITDLKNKNFSILNFYERRLRRIIPVLVFIILVTLPFGWIYLLPIQFIEFSKSALFSLIFSSNLFFWIDGVEYIRTESLFKPYLHTWSLSVEEQYYLIVPFILIFFYKKKQILNILILIFLISFMHSIFSSTKYPVFNFFSLSTRAWEIAAGSIISYLEFSKGSKKIKNNILNEIFVFFGLSLIFISILFFDDKIKHPHLLTTLPIIGTCLILWFANKELLIIKFLSFKIFIIIGLISYSLYLWHYPLFAFARITGLVEGSILNKTILIFLLFILSFLTYYFIEKKFRNPTLKFSLVLKFCLSFIFIIFLFSFLVISNNGFKNRIPPILTQIVNDRDYWINFSNNKKEICLNNIEACRFYEDKNKKLYFIGDSHMATLMKHTTEKLKNEDYTIIFSTFMHCMHYPISIHKNDCKENHYKKLETELINEKNSTIVILGRYSLYLENVYFDNKEGGLEKEAKTFDKNKKFLNQYSKIETNTILNFKKLINNNHKIIIIYPIPEVGWDVPTKLYSKIPKNIQDIENYLIKENFITTSYEVFKKRNESSFKFLDKFEDKNIKRIYPHKLFCDTYIVGRCLANDEKNIFYSDNNHLSLYGSELLVDLILSEL